MLVPLRTAARAPEAGDAIDDMLDCHGRIRHFVELAGKLAGGPEDQIGDAAAAVHRYFSVGLVLHAIDEDISLLPRLGRAAPGAAVLDALSRMVDEHERIETLIGDLVPVWRFLAEGEPRGAPVARRLATGAAELAGVFAAHLELEETILFPAARRLLPPDELAAMRAEMRARR
jgi:iron-sulfur cluster repair protein YtfE (RIC family)